MVNYTLQWFAQDLDVCTSVCDKANKLWGSLCWEPWQIKPWLWSKFSVKMLQITTFNAEPLPFTFTCRVNALILIGSCECLCLRLWEWRIAGLITSPLHDNWRPDNLLVRKPSFYWRFLPSSLFISWLSTPWKHKDSNEYFFSPFALKKS